MPLQGAFTLRANEIFASLANMIISQQVFANHLGSDPSIVDKARVDGGLYGDSKLYYSSDALKSHAWGGDSEATNLLSIHRPADPKVQKIVLDTFRQIDLTVDNYLSKRAWMDEGAFSSFNSVMLGWMSDTKRIHEGTLYNAFIGTAESSVGGQAQTVTLSGTNDGQTLAKAIAKIMRQLNDYTRKFNDYGFIRSYSNDQIKVVWNSDFVDKIEYVDTPTVFHREGLLGKLQGDAIDPRYFGTVITNTNKDTYADNTPAAGKPLDKDGNYAYTPGVNNANGTVRTLKEVEVTVSAVAYHLFPGDEIPTGCKLATTAAAGTLLFGEVYIENPNVICKIFVEYPPIMSAFEVATSFFNAKSLTENHYLTWGYNTLDYLKEYPFITLKKS